MPLRRRGLGRNWWKSKRTVHSRRRRISDWLDCIASKVRPLKRDTKCKSSRDCRGKSHRCGTIPGRTSDVLGPRFYGRRPTCHTGGLVFSMVIHAKAGNVVRVAALVGYDRVFGNYQFRMTMHTETNGKVLLRIGPRGFCAGGVRAVDIVELALEAYGAPVYVHHEIVHNTYVVEQLRRRGAIFVETIEEVPHGAVLVFSAHGVPPTVREEAKSRELKVIDATCPLVTKVHLEALKFAREKRTIILIGHRDHQEIVGTSGEAPDRTIVVDSVAAVDALEVDDPGKLAFLTQTTLSLYDTHAMVTRLRQKFPAIKGPAIDAICYATQNRQEAVEQVAKDVDLILVVGSPNSSNSNRLVEVAQRSGVRP